MTCDLCGKRISPDKALRGLGVMLDAFGYRKHFEMMTVCATGLHHECDRECAELYNMTAASRDDCAHFCIASEEFYSAQT